MCLKKAIEDFNDGDNAALGVIYDEMSGRIFEYAYEKTKNYFESENILEKTMIDVSENSYKYDVNKDCEKWIMSLAKKYVDEVCKRKDISKGDINKNEDEIYFLYNSDGFEPREKKESIIAKCYKPSKELCIEYGRKRKLRNKILICMGMIVALIMLCTLPKNIMKINDYIEASRYLDKYGIEKDELAWDDVIMVYKALSTDDFSNEMVVEVIKNSVKQAGTDGKMIILPADSTVAEMFESIKDSEYEDVEVRYEFYDEKRYNEERGGEVHYRSLLEKYIEDDLVWSKEFSNIEEGYCSGCQKWGDNVLIYGPDDPADFTIPHESYIVLLDGNGNILWELKLDTGYDDNMIQDILIMEESIAVFCMGDAHSCFMEIDAEGNVIRNNIVNTSYSSISGVSRLKNGYGILNMTYLEAVVEELDKNGNGTDNEGAVLKWDGSYRFVDLLEFNGDLYISGYVGRHNRGDFGYYGYHRGEETDPKEIERTTKIYREKYEAMLWRYNERTKKLEIVYSIKGSKGADLKMDKDYMVWNVNGIDEFKYSGGSGVEYIGRSRLYKYVIDEQLRVERKIRTEEFETIWN